MNEYQRRIEALESALRLVLGAAHDDGHTLSEHLHPEIRGMVEGLLKSWPTPPPSKSPGVA